MKYLIQQLVYVIKKLSISLALFITSPARNLLSTKSIFILFSRKNDRW